MASFTAGPARAWRLTRPRPRSRATPCRRGLPACSAARPRLAVRGRSREEPMAKPEQDVRRVLQIRMRTLGEPAQVLALIRSAAPLYQTMGGTGFRVLQNVDEPTQLLAEIEYEAHAALELNRHKLATDPMMRTFLQSWRAILQGSADVDVYEDVTAQGR